MRFGTWLRGAGARAIWLSVACMLLVGQSLNGAAFRSIPGPIGIGDTLAVTVNVTPASGVSVYAVEEFVGSGWEVEGITVNGAFDQHTQTVKWGPFFDNQARELQYVLVPTMDSVFPTEINGTVSVDGVGTSVGGDSIIEERSTLPIKLDPKVEPNSVRRLPAAIEANQAFGVLIEVLPPTSISVYAVEERLASNLSVGEIGEGGAYDASTRTIKWGPFFDNQPRELNYQAVWNGTGESVLEFAGLISLDGQSRSTDGDLEISLGANTDPPPTTSHAVRELPGQGDPSGGFEAQIRVDPPQGVSVYAVEEVLPPGVGFLSASDGGAYDDANRSIKWGPFFDSQSRVLSYRLSIDHAGGNPLSFRGNVSFDGSGQAISGDRTFEPSGTGMPPANGSEASNRQFVRAGANAASVQVRIEVAPPAGTSVYALEESIPAGLSVGAISQGGSWDAASNAIKWGPFFDNSPRTFEYAVELPGGQTQDLAFDGVLSLDGRSEAIGGQAVLSPSNGGNPTPPLPPTVVECSGEGGLLTFSNPRGLVSDLDGDPIGDDVLGQVYVGRSEEAMQPICAPVSSFGLGFFLGGEIPADGFDGGEIVWVQLRAWRGADRFENARIRGASDVATLTLKTPGSLVPAPSLPTLPFVLSEVSLVPPELQPLRIANGMVTIAWTGDGRLQSSDRVGGPYRNTSDQSNPQQIDVSQRAQQFFRVVPQ